MRDLETWIYILIGGFGAATAMFTGLETARDWQVISDVSGIDWIKIIGSFIGGGLAMAKAKLSDSPAAKSEKEQAYINTINNLRDRRK